MNSLERVMATINHRPVDRTPIDYWLYQKQFLERLEADYGPREKFIEEFGVDVFVGLMPFPNQHGRKFDIHELAGVPLEDPRDPKWLNFTDWNYDFGGGNIATAVRDHKGKRCVLAHLPAPRILHHVFDETVFQVIIKSLGLHPFFHFQNNLLLRT